MYGDAPTSKSPHNSFSNLSSNCFDYFISLKRLSLKFINPFSNQQTAKSMFWLAFYSKDCEVTSLFMSVDIKFQQILFRSFGQTFYPALPLPVHY